MSVYFLFRYYKELFGNILRGFNNHRCANSEKTDELEWIQVRLTWSPKKSGQSCSIRRKVIILSSGEGEAICVEKVCVCVFLSSRRAWIHVPDGCGHELTTDQSLCPSLCSSIFLVLNPCGHWGNSFVSWMQIWTRHFKFYINPQKYFPKGHAEDAKINIMILQFQHLPYGETSNIKTGNWFQQIKKWRSNLGVSGLAFKERILEHVIEA